MSIHPSSLPTNIGLVKRISKVSVSIFLFLIQIFLIISFSYDKKQLLLLCNLDSYYVFEEKEYRPPACAEERFKCRNLF